MSPARKETYMGVFIAMALIAMIAAWSSWFGDDARISKTDRAIVEEAPINDEGRNRRHSAAPSSEEAWNWEDHAVDENAGELTPALERKIKSMEIPDEQRPAIRGLARALIRLKDWRKKNLGSGTSSFITFFDEANEADDMASIKAYRSMTPVITLVALADLFRDPSYIPLLRLADQSGRLRPRLARISNEAAALYKSGGIEPPNFDSLTFDAMSETVQAMAQELEARSSEIKMPDLFLSPDFLSANALYCMEPLAKNLALAFGGREFVSLIEHAHYPRKP
jgi:hypothetical protein